MLKSIWSRIPIDKRSEVLRNLNIVIALLSVAVILSAFFVGYRYGQYVTTRDVMDNNLLIPVHQDYP